MFKSIHSEKYRELRTWLIESRTNAGLTLRDVGTLIGVHHSIIGKIETGERRLDLYEYVQLCNILSVDPCEGLKIVNNVKPNTPDTSSPVLR